MSLKIKREYVGTFSHVLKLEPESHEESTELRLLRRAIELWVPGQGAPLSEILKDCEERAARGEM